MSGEHSKAQNMAKTRLVKLHIEEYRRLYDQAKAELGVKPAVRSLSRSEIQHGTTGGYSAEHKRGLKSCAECRAAHVAYVTEWRKRKKDAA